MFTAVTKNHLGLVLVISTVSARSVVNRRSSGGHHSSGVVPWLAAAQVRRQVRRRWLGCGGSEAGGNFVGYDIFQAILGGEAFVI
jgi:hypothetical protein